MALTEMEGLTVLKLDKTEIGKDGSAAICKACAHSAKTLRMLTLGHNNIGPEGAVSVMALLSNPENCLEVLDLTCTGAFVGDVLAMLGGAHAQSLVEFRAGGNKFAPKKVLNAKEGFKPVPALAEFSRSTPLLQLLDVSGTAIPLPALESIMVAVQKISPRSAGEDTGFALHAARCDLGQSQQAMGLLAGTLALMGSMTELALEGNEFVDNDLAALLLSLATNQTLITLRLDKSIPSRSVGRDETMGALTSLLESKQSRLQVLSIAQCRLKRGASAVLQSLGENTQLHTLDLSGNSMGDTGASALAALLHTNRGLTTIMWGR